MNDRSWRAWDYPDDIDVGGGALIGYSVVARDGEIGKVDEATVAVGSSSLVVDTGPWIFGERVLLPAGVVQAIDHAGERVLVERSTDEIKNAPAFDPQRHSSAGYRDEIADYYAGW
jgi:hypothetical protein